MPLTAVSHLVWSPNLWVSPRLRLFVMGVKLALVGSMVAPLVLVGCSTSVTPSEDASTGGTTSTQCSGANAPQVGEYPDCSTDYLGPEAPDDAVVGKMLQEQDERQRDDDAMACEQGDMSRC